MPKNEQTLAEGGVPQSIVEAIARQGAQRASLLEHPEALEAALRKRRRDSPQTRMRMDHGARTNVNMAAVDKQVWDYLQQCAGKDGHCFRPTAALRPQSSPEITPQGVPNLSPPSLPTPIVFTHDINDIYQHTYIDDRGNDDNWWLGAAAGFLGSFPLGLVGLTIAQGGWDTRPFVYYFDGNTAPDDGFYLVSTLVVAWGKYFLKADDQWWDSREVDLKIEGYLNGMIKPVHSEIFSKNAGHIDELGDFAEFQSYEGICELHKGFPLPFQMWVNVSALANGTDTEAVLDMSPGVGALACLGCSLQKIS